MLSSTSHALKEWAIALQALEAGETILLLRKGGIREVGGRFQVKYSQVLLYPTYEHQKPELLKPEYAQVNVVASGWHPNTVPIRSWAEITTIFSVNSESVVNQLLPFQIGNERFIKERFNWTRQPIYLLLLRTYRLTQPVSIPYRQEYGGCTSWIDLEKPISLAGSIPVLDKAEYLQRVKAIQQIVEGTSIATG